MPVKEYRWARLLFQEKVLSRNYGRMGQMLLLVVWAWILTFLFLVLHTIQFVDPRPVVCRIPSERDLKGRQKLVHSREQRLRPNVVLSVRYI